MSSTTPSVWITTPEQLQKTLELTTSLDEYFKQLIPVAVRLQHAADLLFNNKYATSAALVFFHRFYSKCSLS